MILVKDLTLSLGGKALFDQISCSLLAGQKIGLVGKNGAGKSTFLKVLSGHQAVDSGGFSIEKGKVIGYMPQDVVMQSNRPVLEEALSVFADLDAYRTELKELELYLEQHQGEFDPAKIEHYAELQEKLRDSDVDSLVVRARTILSGLGFTPAQLEQGVTQLSLGWRMRLVLAKLLLQQADFYLFDEPTNHLDLVAKEWFVEFLKESNFGYLLVSHDRFFLDTVCEYILELDRGKGTWYCGNYSSFLAQKEEDKARVTAAYVAQQKEIKKKMEVIERFKAKASKAKMAQSMMKSLDKVERIEIERDAKKVRVHFNEVKRAGNVVLTAEDLSKSFNGTQLFHHASLELFRGDKAALIAANGKGKSTLLNLIMGKLEKDSGIVSFGYNVDPAFFEQDQAAVLDPKKTVLEEAEGACRSSEARAKVRQMLGTFLFPSDDVYKKTGVLSGGEKNRVAMVKVLLKDANLLLLDEPTNHLDLDSKDVLLRALQAYTGTILFVSHDRDFLNKLSTKIFELTPNGVVSHDGNYDAYIYHKQQQQKMLEAANAPAPKAAAGKAAPVQQAAAPEKETRKIVPNGPMATSAKDNYELQKVIGRLERKIEKLEAELQRAQEEYALLEYGTAEHRAHEEKMRQIKTTMEETTAEWESSQARLWIK